MQPPGLLIQTRLMHPPGASGRDINATHDVGCHPTVSCCRINSCLVFFWQGHIRQADGFAQTAKDKVSLITE